MKRLIASLLLAASISLAIDVNSYVPNTQTTVVSANVRLYYLNCSNNTASAATLVILDKTTNCGGGCPLWPTVSVPANSKYIASFNGEPATNGFTWQASASSALYCWVAYN